MPNLVQLSNELEYVPKEQLAQMSQDPSSRFPQYLVLSEIQRRTANEKAYAAAKPQPTTTVAEEVVGEFMQPKGLQAGMPSGSAPTDIFSSESIGMPASAPMQQPMQQPMMGMAEGGLTEYMEEVNSELKRIKEKESRYAARNKKQKEGKTIFSSSLSPRNYVIPDEEYKKLTDKGMVRAFDAYRPMGLLFNALSGEGAFSGMDRTIPESKLKNLESAMKQSRNEMQQRQQGLASGGLTAFAAGDRTALDETFYNPLESVKEFASDRYYDEEGDFNYLTALGDASILIPGLGLAGAGARGLYGLGRTLTGAVTGKGLKDKSLRGLQSLFTKPGVSKKEIAATRKQAYENSVKRAVDQQKKSLGVKATDNKQLVAMGKDTLVPMGSKNLPIKAGGRIFDAKKTFKNIGYPTGAAVAISRLGGEDIPTTQQELQELNTGLGGIVKEKPKREIDYDLVNLGGIIMGSRNMSELGKGISGLAQSSSKRKIEKEALATQNELRKAQAAKYRADLKTMGFNEIQSEIQLINEASETGALDIQDPVIQNYLMSLYEALAKRRGGSLQDDILKQQQAS
tara:strand:- start:7434 stop:9143 length:1710 start_codon:yes stop_codon:yes gene_type:complete